VTFLEPDEIRVLTGKAQKAKQIEQLRRMGIPFYVNASGHPVIARVTVEGGRKDQPETLKPWRPAVLGA
jgi:hypothetical protein